ncbi:hypothetical protein Tco_0123621 [Tanacetum coccineum]
MSQAKEAQIKLYKTREDKELDKVIALENKVKVLNDIVYKTGQSVQTMNMLNRNCKTSFAKPEFLKKAQRANPRLYDIGCYNDNLALMLAPDSDEMIHLEKEQEMVADLRYFNSLENEVDTLKSQLETQKTQFLNEIDRLSREYYYADHMNAILGVYTDLDEFTNLQCDYVETWEKCEHLEKELSKSRTMSKEVFEVSRGSDLYSISLQTQQLPIQFANAKATRLKHGYGIIVYLIINFEHHQLAFPRIYYKMPSKAEIRKDHLGSSCSWGKQKESLFTIRLPRAQKDVTDFYHGTYVVHAGRKH